MSKTIAAVIPIREGSQRMPNKNFVEFYQGKSLLELKIEALKKIDSINEIIINTNSDLAIKIAKKQNVSYFKRDEFYASSIVSQSKFFRNLAETTDSDIIVHSPCTSPLIKNESIKSAINLFLKSDNDSCNSVGLVKDYLWKNGKPLNYSIDSKEVPNSQDLPDIKKLTFGFGIIERYRMIERENVVGSNPLFYVVDEIEETDIDTKLDFMFAKYLYNFNKNG